MKQWSGWLSIKCVKAQAAAGTNSHAVLGNSDEVSVAAHECFMCSNRHFVRVAQHRVAVCACSCLRFHALDR